MVHQFWRDEDSGAFAPRPGPPVHTDELVTAVPFLIDIDLRDRVEA